MNIESGIVPINEANPTALL